jgi:hypothetical protein
VNQVEIEPHPSGAEELIAIADRVIFNKPWKISQTSFPANPSKPLIVLLRP